MSEIRKSRLLGEWVIIAPERAERGGHLLLAPNAAEIPAFAPTCPFCPGNEGPASEESCRVAGHEGRWAIRSLINKYFVLSAGREVVPMAGVATCGDAVNGVGLHEVLIESPRHDFSIARSSINQMQRILEADRHRFRAFYMDPRVRPVIVFKNYGADAGASQQQPHS